VEYVVGIMALLERIRRTLRGTASRSTAPKPELPWSILRTTGNGTGGAPSSLQGLAGLSDEAFDATCWDRLFDVFLHQGTIYCATPFAVREVVSQLAALSKERQDTLVYWCHCCLYAESLGNARPSWAGVWLPASEEEALTSAGVIRPTVREVLLEHLDDLEALRTGSSPQPDDVISRLIELLTGDSVRFPDDDLATDRQPPLNGDVPGDGNPSSSGERVEPSGA
jgi:hypothetical protein